MKKSLIDLYNVEEDDRIKLIAHHVIDHKQVVGIMVDVEDGSHVKGDRYIEKIKKLYPQISVMFRGDGPVANVETIQLGVVN